MDFKLWRATRGDEFCVIKGPDIPNSFELDKGIPRLEAMASPARCSMDPSFPKQIQLSDNLYGATVPVISRRLRQVLEPLVTNRVEYLPVELINHKGRAEKSDYFILHPLDVIDCIDQQASKVQWNTIMPDRISNCQSLILKSDMIPQDATLFRLKYWGRNIVIRQDLVELLEKANLTGLFFKPPKEYWGIG